MKNKRVLFILLLVMLTNLFRTDMSAELILKYDVDFSQSSKGIVKVFHNKGSNIKSKLIIQSGTSKYIYNITDDKEYVDFPLQLGSGNYTVEIFENTTGTKYKIVYSETRDVNIDSEDQVFLSSNQQINWTSQDEAILLATQLIEEGQKVKSIKTKNGRATLSESEKIDILYNYVVQNIQYDFDKIEILTYDYIPDIDEVLNEKKGICFDYAVLLASLLRSQGIPTKLIKGFSTNTTVYHAWNEIFLTSEKRWIVVDTTYDAYMYVRQKQYTIEKSNNQYMKELEF